MKRFIAQLAFFILFILAVESSRHLKAKVLTARSTVFQAPCANVVSSPSTSTTTGSTTTTTGTAPAQTTTTTTPATTTTTTPATTTTTTPATTTTTPTTSTTTTPATSTTTTPTAATNGSLTWSPCKIAVNMPGMDIADNFTNFPDPFAFYTNTNYAGVTLIGPTRAASCGWVVGKNFQWDANWETCILNGQGYPLEWSTPGCGNAKFSASVTPASYLTLFSQWQNYALNNATKFTNTDGSTAYLTTYNLNGQTIQAAMSIGHGVLTGLCGDCFLVNQGTQYVALLQTDVRAWSLELSGGANVWLAPDNVGGTCHIPQVTPVPCQTFMH